MSRASVTALLREVLAHPDNDAVRTVYADALLGTGDPRGEYIAAAIAGRWEDLQRLETAHGASWRMGIPEDIYVDYRHGFIEGLEGPSASLAVAIAALAGREPVVTLRVTDDPDEPDAWIALLETPAFATIRDLRIIGAHAPPALLRHPGARALEAIEFRWEIHPDAFDDTPDPLVAELPALAPLPGLRSFGVVTEHYLIPGLVAAIAAAPFLATVETLALGAAHEPADVRALLESPHLARVRALDLPCLHDEGIRALADHPGAARLERLRLTSNRVTDEGARALATSPVLRDDLELTIPKKRHRSIDRFQLKHPS